MQLPSTAKTIVVGLSGGVDSAVTALLLKEQGFTVVGMFMKNWEEQINGVCTSQQDFDDVVAVSKQLGITYYPITFAKEYQELVFTYFLEELKKGNTPNPDILCNREIKFKLLLETAKKLGADALATGHYAINNFSNGEFFLDKARDHTKDQTYFLYTTNQHILSQALFPIGHLTKSEVREIAKKHNLAVAKKKDSTGICFIGKRDFRSFLEGYIQYSSGKFRTLDGKVVGTHQGVAYYTIGQRRGLAIGGPGDAYFVVGKDVAENIIWVAQGKDHPALFSDTLHAHSTSWIAGHPPGPLPYACKAKIRYRQEDVPCIIEEISDERVYVRFLHPQRAITVSQSIVFYQGPHCLGGAIIESSGPSYWDEKKPLPSIVTT